MKILESHLKTNVARSAGKCVIGTIKGDLQ